MGTKHRLAIVCKTYQGDFKSFCKLYDSYKAHNVDNIPLYVSIPEKDHAAFAAYCQDDDTLITDESYANEYFADTEYWGLPLGYINQEICKLSFWENDLAENYLFVDSDAYFIRDFYESDFMFDKSTPYSVLTMDKDLHIERFYKDYGAGRKQHIQRIFDRVGLNDKRLLTCHGMTAMNTKVLSDFKGSFMKKNNLSYRDLVEISPFEYSWYNAWLQKSNIIEVKAVEPFFKTFHMRIEYLFSRLKQITETDLATQYVGIILNSNWKPKGPPPRYESPTKFHKLLYKALERMG